MTEDFLCEECRFPAQKGGICPRCGSELVNLKTTDVEFYDAEEDPAAEDVEPAMDGDFDFSDEVLAS